MTYWVLARIDQCYNLCYFFLELFRKNMKLEKMVIRHTIHASRPGQNPR